MPDYWGFNEGTPRKSLAQRDRKLVWQKEFGSKTRGLCPICKKHMIYETNFQAGHKKSLKNGGTNSSRNLRPICQTCNTQMGSMNMSEYKRKYARDAKSAPKKKAKSSNKSKSVRKTPEKTKAKSTRKRTRRSSSKDLFGLSGAKAPRISVPRVRIPKW